MTVKQRKNKNNQRKENGKRTAPRLWHFFTDGPIFFLLTWTRAELFCLSGYEPHKHLYHVCTADWMPLWTKLIAVFPSGVNWMLSQLPLNFQLCFQPKLVLKLGVWAWSRPRKGWGQMMKCHLPKTLLSTEPLGESSRGQGAGEVWTEGSRGLWC